MNPTVSLQKSGLVFVQGIIGFLATWTTIYVQKKCGMTVDVATLTGIYLTIFTAIVHGIWHFIQNWLTTRKVVKNEIPPVASHV